MECVRSLRSSWLMVNWVSSFFQGFASCLMGRMKIIQHAVDKGVGLFHGFWGGVGLIVCDIKIVEVESERN